VENVLQQIVQKQPRQTVQRNAIRQNARKWVVIRPGAKQKVVILQNAKLIARKLQQKLNPALSRNVK
jgi:hypothetical protein